MKLRRVFFVAIIIASIFIINNLARSIYGLWTKKELVLDMKNEAKRQQEENEVLKKKLSTVEQPQFIEKEARNKLFLAKPGDEVVVLSAKELAGNQINKSKPIDTRLNWQKWWDLFF